MQLTAFCNRMAISLFPGEQSRRFIIKMLRVMRLTIVIIVICFLQVSARSWSQTITLSGERLSLEQVFKVIESQTNLLVIYKPSMLQKTTPVTVRITKVPVRDFLEEILQGQGLSCSFKKSTIFIQEKIVSASLPSTSKDLPQFEPVMGVIKAEDGQPLKDVSVRIKGQTRTVITDQDGIFTLNLNIGDILIISHISFKSKEYKITSYSPISLTLEKKELLMDTSVVISTGYQDLPKERATGSFVTINNKLLNEQISTNILDRLDGIASGVLFNRGVAGTSQNQLNANSLSIRGLSTLGTGEISNPLIVVDNFIYDGNINNINPNEVEKITVLKDAAASSIWGTRAANGVILITTKAGKYNQKAKVTFTSNFNITGPPDLYYIPQMPSSEFVDLEMDLFKKGYYDVALNSTAITGTNVNPSPVVLILNRQRKGELSEEVARQMIDKYRNLDIRDDLNKYFYQTAIERQYSLNIQGGGVNYNYSLSGGFDKNESERAGNERDRVNIRSFSSLKPVRNMEIQTGIGFVQNKESGPNIFQNAVLGTTANRWPYAQMADENGNAVVLPSSYRSSYSDTAGADGRLLDWKYRPLDELRLANIRRTSQDILINLHLSYQFIPGLKATIKYQYERLSTDSRNLKSVESFVVRSDINRFTPPGGSYTNSAIPYGDILDQENSGMNSRQIRGQIDYARDWKQIKLAAIAGMESRERHTYSFSDRTYGYDDEVMNFKNVDLVNQYRLYTGGTGYIPTVNTFSDRTYRFISFYSNASLTYKERYTFSMSARRDASNLFGVNTNDKWQPLWSAGFAWDLFKEQFYRVTWLPFIKLKATYGYQGNVDNSIAAAFTLRYLTSADSRSNLPQSVVNNVPNPDLKWENVAMTNLAIDFGTAGNKITGNVEYYVKHCRDLLVQDLIDITIGAGESVTRNAGILRTRGLDITINTENIRRGNVTWSTQFLASWNTNRVIKYSYVPTSINLVLNNGNDINPIKDKPAYGLINYAFAGLDSQTGEPLGYLDGSPTKDYQKIMTTATIDDLVFQGSARAPFFGNVRNTFSWKGWSLSTNITFTLGHYFRIRPLDPAALYSGGNVRGDLSTYHAYQRRWQKPGDEEYTNFPAVSYPVNSNASTFMNTVDVNVKKADVVRLHFVNLGYTFTNQKNSWLPFSNLQVFCNLRNIAILWKATDEIIDPDTMGAPIPMSTALGCRISF